MSELMHYQVRGLPGSVARTYFNGRRVDYWAPAGGSDRVVLAHDGQNIFDKKTATRGKTWELAQRAISVSEEFGITPPLVIGTFHSASAQDPFGRAKDLAPQHPFQNGVTPILGRSGFWQREQPSFPLDEIRSDHYLAEIAEVIIPTIAKATGSEIDSLKSAMLGSSMGGLATLYGVNNYPHRFQTALAFSPHWIIGENPLVDALITPLTPGKISRLWMSRGSKGLDKGYEPFQNYANELAIKNGWHSGVNFIHKVYPRTGHNERSWSSYLSEALRFWLHP